VSEPETSLPASPAPEAPALSPTLTWAERKARASIRSRTARANQNAMDYLSQHETDGSGTARILVIAAMVTKMSGSKFDFDEKATVVLAPAKKGEDSEVLDLYGAAGVTAVRALVEELGPGPWEESLPFSLEAVETTRGDRPVIVPLF
jgi:hypothetical protein